MRVLKRAYLGGRWEMTASIYGFPSISPTSPGEAKPWELELKPQCLLNINIWNCWWMQGKILSRHRCIYHILTASSSSSSSLNDDKSDTTDFLLANHEYFVFSPLTEKVDKKRPRIHREFRNPCYYIHFSQQQQQQQQ